MARTTRNPHAAEAAEHFIRSLFSQPGVELRYNEIERKAIVADIACSPSTVNAACQRMTKEGFLAQPAYGVYARAVSPATPLPMPTADATAPTLAAPADPTVVYLAGIQSRLTEFNDKLDALHLKVERVLAALSVPA